LDDQEGKLKNNSGGGGDVEVELMLVLFQEIRKRKVYVVVRERAV
jgi:ClpP class serine protease